MRLAETPLHTPCKTRIDYPSFRFEEYTPTLKAAQAQEGRGIRSSSGPLCARWEVSCAACARRQPRANALLSHVWLVWAFQGILAFELLRNPGRGGGVDNTNALL